VSIEERLHRVEAELAIRRILFDYSAFLDEGDVESYVGLFANEGEWSNPAGSYRGQAAIRQMLLSALGSGDRPRRRSFHLNSNARIDVDGDQATAISRFLFVTRGADRRPFAALAGRYTDTFVREGGTWKISRRVAEDIIPDHAEWMEMIAGS
jgi:3-phenylpropionate/cinnamic acid dioxygenase small subunit